MTQVTLPVAAAIESPCLFRRHGALTVTVIGPPPLAARLTRPGHESRRRSAASDDGHRRARASSRRTVTVRVTEHLQAPAPGHFIATFRVGRLGPGRTASHPPAA